MLQPARVVVTEILAQLQKDGHCSSSEATLMMEIYHKVNNNSFLGLNTKEIKVINTFVLSDSLLS